MSHLRELDSLLYPPLSPTEGEGKTQLGGGVERVWGLGIENEALDNRVCDDWRRRGLTVLLGGEGQVIAAQ